MSQSESTELGDELYAQIKDFCREGDRLAEGRDFLAAIAKYQAALELLPEPFQKWDAATWILTAMGDAFFLSGDNGNALNVLLQAMHCPKAIGNAFIHLRLGQSQYEVGNEILAKDELARAYMGGGSRIFEGEDKKYFDLVKQSLKAPREGW